jgi:clan AA aspartic protease
MPLPTKQEIGKVLVTLKVTNRADQIRFNDGAIASDQIRAIELKDVLIDTGATTLCLPSDVINKLGLELLKEVDVTTATGISKARIFQDAKILLGDREGTFECLELPGGKNALLGVIPLETLGIEIDLKNQTLKFLPITSTDTYLTIL